MAGFTKKEAFIKQVALYLKNEDYRQAYPMAKELVTKFPDDLAGHFLLSKTAFWLDKYDESINEGRKAFNMSNEKDMLICAILSLFGVIHSVMPAGDAYLPWNAGNTIVWEIAAGYALVAAGFAATALHSKLRSTGGDA